MVDLNGEDEGNPAELVENRSDELILELRDYGELVRAGGLDADDREIFEGWAIQKLAGLQLIAEELNRELRRLGTERRRGGRKP